MTLRELKSIRILRKRICELDEAIETLRSEMEKTTPTLSQAPCRAGEGDKRASQIARMIELKAERRDKICRLYLTIDVVETWLYTLPEQQAKVMRARYVEGMSLAQAAKAMGYRKSHCQKICDSALKKCC